MLLREKRDRVKERSSRDSITSSSSINRKREREKKVVKAIICKIQSVCMCCLWIVCRNYIRQNYSWESGACCWWWQNAQPNTDSIPTDDHTQCVVKSITVYSLVSHCHWINQAAFISKQQQKKEPKNTKRKSKMERERDRKIMHVWDFQLYKWSESTDFISILRATTNASLCIKAVFPLLI